jgi:hypothetical protein
MMSDDWDCQLQQKTDSPLAELRIATLWNTFGTNTECLKTYFADSRLKAIEIHLINEVCQRRGTCGNYEFLYGMSMAEYNRALRIRDPEFLKRVNNYFKAPASFIAANLRPGTDCYVSPGLESNLDLSAARVLIQQARESFPNCKIVWNPVNGSKAAKPISGTVFEQHHPDASLSPPCIANLDGFDIGYPSRSPILPQNVPSTRLTEVAETFRLCDLNFLWIAEYNGISDFRRLPDPRVRTAFPTESTFALVIDSLMTLQRTTGLFEDSP